MRGCPRPATTLRAGLNLPPPHGSQLQPSGSAWGGLGAAPHRPLPCPRHPSHPRAPVPVPCAQVADRIKKHMTPRVPRILPADVETTVKDWAANVEGLVDKVVSGKSAPERAPGPAACRLRSLVSTGWAAACGTAGLDMACQRCQRRQRQQQQEQQRRRGIARAWHSACRASAAAAGQAAPHDAARSPGGTAKPARRR